MVTDLGVNLAFMLRGVDKRRELTIHAALFAGFFAGGVTTSALWSHIGYGVLVVPMALCLVAAAASAWCVARPEVVGR